jgi:hypothetical protein
MDPVLLVWASTVRPRSGPSMATASTVNRLCRLTNRARQHLPGKGILHTFSDKMRSPFYYNQPISQH